MPDPSKLTSYSHGAGCACKLGMLDLQAVLDGLGPGASDPSVLVGLDEADDAAVVRLPGGDGLVLTLDFFTPLVDDAATWGAIAAANAAGDVYAMGGRPLYALNVLAWPRDELPMSLVADVLRGARDVAARGGFTIVGGHTVDDPEPKYGLVVIGRVDPDAMLRLDAAAPGDVLVLTKPIGTGMITTAIKRDAASEGSVAAAVASMTHLNASASEALLAHGVRAATDVTGFGLLGHMHRMLRASGVGAELDASAVPTLPGARDLAGAGTVAGGTRRNLEAVAEAVRFTDPDDLTPLLLADAQTSGGLLAACPPDRVDALVGALSAEPAAAVIGRVAAGTAGAIAVAGRVR